MKILAVDVGTGTQDILLFDSRLAIENSLKLVLPSPTMMIHRRIKEATARRAPILLAGRLMGGGPSAWAAEAHARGGLHVFATPAAALTLDDDLTRVAEMGVQIVSEDEAAALPATVERLELGDFHLRTFKSSFESFGVTLNDLDAVAVAAFDHGAAPPGTSDRQFRFDYLDQRIREKNSLGAFAYVASDVPAMMSRLRAVAESGATLDCPLVVMDTAPAAVLGATLDPTVGAADRALIVNVGNFHTLAFRLHRDAVEGVFEHHTGEITLSKLESLLIRLADSSLRHADVFEDMGHGALIYSRKALELGRDQFDVVVTGPRRALYQTRESTRLRPYFAVPYGDMMLSGCFGLLAATAELLPEFASEMRRAMRSANSSVAPWELD